VKYLEDFKRDMPTEIEKLESELRTTQQELVQERETNLSFHRQLNEAFNTGSGGYHP